MLEKVSESKRLCCNAGCQKFGRCGTRGESEDHEAMKHSSERSTLALKPRAYIRRPEEGTSGTIKTTHVHQKLKTKTTELVSVLY